jgi:hypothetical protein
MGHGLHTKHYAQQFFYCCIYIYSVMGMCLPGCSLEMTLFWLHYRWTHTHRQQISYAFFHSFKIRNVGQKCMSNRLCYVCACMHECACTQMVWLLVSHKLLSCSGGRVLLFPSIQASEIQAASLIDKPVTWTPGTFINVYVHLLTFFHTNRVNLKFDNSVSCSRILKPRTDFIQTLFSEHVYNFFFK